LLLLGRTVHVIEHSVGHSFEEQIWRRSYSCTDLGMFSKAENVGTVFVAEVFLLVGKVILLLYCTFLKVE
jgi:hypothetical protein